MPRTRTHGDHIRQAVRDQPGATRADLRQKLGPVVALPTPWAAVAELGLRLGKK